MSESSPEGLKHAATTREVLKRKREELQSSGQKAEEPPQAKRQQRSSATCIHQVALPKNYQLNKQLDPETYGTLQDPQYKGEAAQTYPFALDAFQTQSIACLERKESVLVAAHTSAGKTVVATYAIAMAFRENQRVIYTSPLKALSNQKYRELCEQFNNDVGLMTGDVVQSPDATCIVMTTEILRSMLYKGSELMREIAWVIFDEVHYMQDRERGVVWEETIIFLPKQVRMVFLSATLSNSLEFAQWVAQMNYSPCHVVQTDTRPVPLVHFAFPFGGIGLYLVKDEQGAFRQDSFKKIKAAFQAKQEASGTGGDRQGITSPAWGNGGGDKKKHREKEVSVLQDMNRIVSLVKKRGLEPVIVFAFSRRECEVMALEITKRDTDFIISDTEREAIELVFDNALNILREEDRNLPAIEHIRPMLKKGIAVHHSGLFPILKEVVEILFQEGLIKCLFATETFAMGLNMPAKTVIFTGMKKWDGKGERWLTSGEYIQMSGRAGRRGKDDRGSVIMMVDNSMDEEQAKTILLGKPSPLLSSFRLSYYTLLNLLRRVEGTNYDMDYVIKHSFQQFQHNNHLPEYQRQLDEVYSQIKDLIGEQGGLEEYMQLRGKLSVLESELMQEVLRPDRCMYFMRPGRILQVKIDDVDWGWGILVNVHRNLNNTQDFIHVNGNASFSHNYTMDILLGVDGKSVNSGEPMPGKIGDEGVEFHVIPVPLTYIRSICSMRMSLPEDLRTLDMRKSIMLQLKDYVERFPDGLPLIDPINDMDIKDEEFKAVIAQIEDLEHQMINNPFHDCENDSTKLDLLRKRANLQAKADEIQAMMSKSQLDVFQEESKARKKVLRRLGYIDKDDIVTLKGRAACEIDTADELLSAELLLNGTFNGLDKHQLVALVSVLIPTEKSNEIIRLSKDLSKPLQALQNTARQIAEISNECGLEVDQEEYLESFKPSLMDIMHGYSIGKSFAEILQMTDLFEGSIIRAARRLEELIGQLAKGAEVVGDKDLVEKFNEALSTIRRGIMFAASLYI